MWIPNAICIISVNPIWKTNKGNFFLNYLWGCDDLKDKGTGFLNPWGFSQRILHHHSSPRYRYAAASPDRGYKLGAHLLKRNSQYHFLWYNYSRKLRPPFKYKFIQYKSMLKVAKYHQNVGCYHYHTSGKGQNPS